MIVQAFVVLLIISVASICGVTGASYSNVFVESEIAPRGYYTYGTPYPSIANPRLSQINSLPSVPGYVAPCVLPCVYPAQTVATVAPVDAAGSNVLTYNAPSVPIVVEPTKQDATGYEYSYVVYDDNTGDHKAQRELSDGSIVRGEYSFLQPDGLVRQVQYVADDISGFNAVVKQYLPTAVEGHGKVEGQGNKESSPPCHEIKNESLKEDLGEISINKNMEIHGKLHNKHSNEESAEKSKGHHGASKESGEEENSKEKHNKVSNEESGEDSDAESHENQSKKLKHSKEASGEESEEKSKEKHHNKSKEPSGESKEQHHKKSKKESKESGEESEEETDSEELKEKSRKKSSKGSDESREKNKKNFKKGSKDRSNESGEESEEVGHGKHKEVYGLIKPNQEDHSLLNPNPEALVPYNDIIRCIEAAVRRNYGVPAAMRQEPSPLTYIVLNKPC